MARAEDTKEVPAVDLNDGKKVWDGLKSKLGIGAKGQAQGQAYDDAYYDQGYDSYGEYDEYGYDQGYAAPGYDGYDEYGAQGGYDEYERYAPEPRSSRSAGGSSLPHLVSMNDARASARRATSYQESRAERFSTPRGFSAERDMYDSSLPYEMTPEGSAAASARGTRRYEEGFVSPYEAADAARAAGSGYADEALSRTSADLSASSASIQERTSASLAALRERIASSGTVRTSSASASAASSAPAGPRKVTVVKPIRYGEADRIPAALKKGEAVVLVLKGVSGGLDKRILDFSFGAASSLDAEVECIADKVFFIAKGSGLTDDERASLQAQGVL